MTSVQNRLDELRERYRRTKQDTDPATQEPAKEYEDGRYSDVVFELDGLRVTGSELFDHYPVVRSELSDNLPALELIATSILVVKHLRKNYVPRILWQAAQTSFWRGE